MAQLQEGATNCGHWSRRIVLQAEVPEHGDMRPRKQGKDTQNVIARWQMEETLTEEDMREEQCCLVPCLSVNLMDYFSSMSPP